VRATDTAGKVAGYTVVYEKTGTGYSAYAPDLPGCITTGKTHKETKRLMGEAIEFHVAGMREDGLPIPEPTTTMEDVPGTSIGYHSRVHRAYRVAHKKRGPGKRRK
jgi:predicted RNase H-like HicB family nuclease